MSTFTPEPITNTMNFIVSVSNDDIDVNMCSTQTSEEGSQEISNAEIALQSAWTNTLPTGVPANLPNGSANTQNLTYQQILQNVVPSGGPYTIHQFITAYIDTTNAKQANQFSLAFITEVIGDINTCEPPSGQSGSTNDSSLDLSACNSENTLISSTSTDEEQPEQTLGRSYGTMLQQFQSSISTLGGIADTAIEANSSIIALIAQSA